MTSRPRRRLLLGLGLLLVTVPLWAPPLDVTGAEYEYSAALVTAEDNRLDVPRDPPRLDGIPNVDCFEAHSPSRLCGFESTLVDAPPSEVRYPGLRHVAGEPTLAAPGRYVAFTGDGRVYERTTAWNDSAGTYVLGLERANATRALAQASRPVQQYPGPVREAVEAGSARADEPLSEPVLVASSGRYYAVYTTGTGTFLSERPLTERLFELVAVLVGAVLLATGRGTADA